MVRVWLIVVASLVSVWGSRMTFVGTGVWLFSTHESASQLAWVAIVAIAPGLVAQPWVGRQMDCFSPRWVWLIGTALALVCGVGFWWLLAHDRVTLPVLMAVAGLASLASAVNQPFVMKLIKAAVPEARYLTVNSVRTVGFSVVELAVPAMATWLLTHYSLATIVAVDVASVMVCALVVIACWSWLAALEHSTPKDSGKDAGQPSSTKRVSNGAIAYPLGNWIRRVVVIQGVVGMVMIGFMPLAIERLSVVGYGWCVTLAGSAGVVGALLSARWPTRWLRTQGVDGLIVVLCGGLIVLALSKTIGLFVAMAMMIGGVYAAATSIVQTGCLKATGETNAGGLMGRVFMWGGLASMVAAAITGALVDGVAARWQVEPGLASAWVMGTVGVLIITACGIRSAVSVAVPR